MNLKNNLKDKFNSISYWSFSDFIVNLIKILCIITFTIASIVSLFVVLNFYKLRPINNLILERSYDEYILMFTQSFIGLLVIIFAKPIINKLKISIPNFFWSFFYLILFLAIYLGEVNNYYNRFTYWDDLLHCLSAAILTFFVYSLLNSIKSIKNSVHPILLIILSFCISTTCCTIWEIYEFSIDHFFNTNMQKYMFGNTYLIGRAALKDTMQDLIVGSIGSFIASIICFIAFKHNHLLRNSVLIKFTETNNKDTK